MAIKHSEALLNGVLTTGSLKSLFEDGAGFELRVYSGTDAPATANGAETGTLLNTYTANDTGAPLLFDAAASGGVLTKDPAQPWAGTPVETGSPLYFRFVRKDDDGAASATAIRIQGLCGIGEQQMNFTTLALTQGRLHLINYVEVPFADPYNNYSEALRNYLLVTGSLTEAMGSFEVRVWGGADIPASAQSAAVGTLLNTYTNNGMGGGLQFESAASSGVLQKDSSQLLAGEPFASGVPRYFRIVRQGDTNALDAAAIRIQGPCQGARALHFEAGALTASVAHVIRNMSVVLLPSYA